MTTKFGRRKSDMYVYVTGVLKISESRPERKSKKAKNALFWYFFYSPEPYPAQITTNTGIKIGHQAAYANAQTNFCKNSQNFSSGSYIEQ